MRVTTKFTYCLLIVIAIAILLTLPGLGEKEFYTRGEPREALAAQSIVKEGSWVLPQAYAGSIPSKPPLAHWMMALFSLPEGTVTPFTARLPAALASILISVGFFLFLSSRVSLRLAFITFLIVCTSVEWSRAAVTSRVDMLLAASFVGALLLLYRWWEQGLKGAPLAVISLLLAGTLTKGPVALVLPAIIFTIFLLTEKTRLLKIIDCLCRAFLPPLLLALLWYIAAYHVGGEPFLSKVWNENFARFLGSMEDGDDPHKATIFYLYSTVIIGILPWTLMLAPIFFAACKDGWCNLSAKFFTRQTVQRWIHAWRASPAHDRFFSLIVVATILFYSVPSSKRSVYLLPIYPFLAYAVALFLQRWSYDSVLTGIKICKIFIYLSSFSLLVLCTAPLWWQFIADYITSVEAHSFVQAIAGSAKTNPISFVSALIALVSIIVLLPRASRSSSDLIIAQGGYFAALLFALNIYFLPMFANQLSPRPFAVQISRMIPQDARIVSYDHDAYGVSFYLERQMHTVFRKENKTFFDGDYIVLYEEQLPHLKSALPSTAMIEQLARSEQAVVRPGRHQLLVLLHNRDSHN